MNESPLKPVVTIILTLEVKPENVDEISNDLKTLIDGKDIYTAKIEQTTVNFEFY